MGLKEDDVASVVAYALPASKMEVAKDDYVSTRLGDYQDMDEAVSLRKCVDRLIERNDCVIVAFTGILFSGAFDLSISEVSRMDALSVFRYAYCFNNSFWFVVVGAAYR